MATALPLPAENVPGKDLVLGIDIGTTTVKISVISADTKEIVYEKARKTSADITNVSATYAETSVKNFDGFSEQDVRKIWSTVNSLLSEIDVSLTGRIKAVGLCGQQHGVMLWNEASCREFVHLDRDIPDSCRISNLITWQDQRCSLEFIASLPKPNPKQVIATGYGTCLLFWLAKHAPEHLKGYDRAGTVMDFVAAQIVAYGQMAMSPHNAETWGFFDRFENSWNIDILNAAGFPVDLLPGLVGRLPFVGPLRYDPPWHGVTGYSNPVGMAMGDLQCSFLGTVQNDDDAVLNFSTSAQISFVRTRTDLPVPPSCDVRTYFGKTETGSLSHSGRELIVAPSLNGGNVLTFFVQILKTWMECLNGSLSTEEIWQKMIPLVNEKNWTDINDPVVKPTLYGERYDADLKASIGNVSITNCDLGSVVRGILKGVVDNLEEMLPADYLRQSAVKRIVLTGSLFKTFPQLVQHVSKVFQLPVVVRENGGDAAYGAALGVSNMLKEARNQYL